MSEKHILPLTREELDQLDELDLDAMTENQLRILLVRVRTTYPLLEQTQPADEDSEEYLLWQEDLETLDDYIDELTDRLDA